jgi:hypothetical protein
MQEVASLKGPIYATEHGIERKDLAKFIERKKKPLASMLKDSSPMKKYLDNSQRSILDLNSLEKLKERGNSQFNRMRKNIEP